MRLSKENVMKSGFSVGAAALLCVSFVSASQATNTWSLTSTDPEERWRAQEEIESRVESAINDAIGVLENTHGEAQINDIRLTAIEVLRILRAKRGVSALVKMIDFEGAFPAIMEAVEITPSLYYPATRALVEIGDASIPECIRALEKSSQRKRALLCWVIKEIEGDELGVFLLEKRIGSSQGEAKSNLQESVKYLRSDTKWRYQAQSKDE